MPIKPNSEQSEDGKPRVPGSWDSRVAEARGILLHPWSVFTTGFFVQEERKDEAVLGRSLNSNFCLGDGICCRDLFDGQAGKATGGVNSVLPGFSAISSVQAEKTTPAFVPTWFSAASLEQCFCSGGVKPTFRSDRLQNHEPPWRRRACFRERHSRGSSCRWRRCSRTLEQDPL